MPARVPPLVRQAREIKFRKIKLLYKLGLNMDQICKEAEASKTTVFFAIRGRSKKSNQNKNQNNN